MARDRGFGLGEGETAEYRRLNPTTACFFACLAHTEQIVGVDRSMERLKREPLG